MRGRRLAQIDGMAPSLLALPAGCAFRPRCVMAQAICEAEPPVQAPATGRMVRCVLPVRDEVAA